MQTLKTTLCVALASLTLTGCALFPEREHTTVRIHEQVSSALPAENTLIAEIPSAELRLAVTRYAILSEKDVLSAELYDTAGGQAILLRFDAHGTIVLDEATTRSRGQYLVTFINARPVAAWLVNQRVLNGQLLVEGDFSDEEAKQVVEALNKISKTNRR
jgi:preprotein translocase subunit SecD